MPENKPPRINTRRIYITPLQPPWGPHIEVPPDIYGPTPLPMETAEATPVVPGVEFEPYVIPSEGDPVEKKGYVDYLRIDEEDYAAGLDVDYMSPTRADYFLEKRTYCVVGISKDVDKSTGVVEFRVLSSDIKGEKLAVSMAVIATLKDAFLKRSLVRLHGTISQLEVSGVMMLPPSISDLFNTLMSVTLLRA